MRQDPIMKPTYLPIKKTYVIIIVCEDMAVINVNSSRRRTRIMMILRRSQTNLQISLLFDMICFEELLITGVQDDNFVT